MSWTVISYTCTGAASSNGCTAVLQAGADALASSPSNTNILSLCVMQTQGCIWNWVSTSIHTVETVQFIVQTSGVFFRSNFGSQPQMQGRKYEELQFLILLIRNCFAIASNKTPRIIFRYNNEDDIQCYSKKNTILDLCSEPLKFLFYYHNLASLLGWGGGRGAFTRGGGGGGGGGGAYTWKSVVYTWQ